jgi:hypothetical protein
VPFAVNEHAPLATAILEQWKSNMKYLATVCLFVLVTITQINAQHSVKALSGNQMLVDCVPKNGVARYYLCLGYALGLAEGFMTGLAQGASIAVRRLSRAFPRLRLLSN